MSLQINISLPKRDFYGSFLRLSDQQGRKKTISIHPVILASCSLFFDKVVFLSGQNSTVDSSGDGSEKNPYHCLVPDLFGAIDVINSLYGEKTNSGGRKSYERELFFNEQKIFSIWKK